jgi:TPR repeat protein
VSAPAEAPKTDDRLTIRAEELFHKGDVSGARLLLERALDGGNARAAFLLAETFDPNVLSRLGVLGIRGDGAKAREFYARARAMGITLAGERMEALK